MQIKRIWRFLKWIYAGVGFFEACWFLAAMFLGAAVTAQEEHKTVLYGIALAFVAIFMIKMIWELLKMSWNRFIEDYEKAFNILKDKNIK